MPMMPSTPTLPGLQAGASSSSPSWRSSLYQNIAPDQPAVPIDSALDRDFVALGNELPRPLRRSITADSEMITNIANAAIDELIRLSCMNEPFWFRSIVDGKFILQRETYEKTFHMTTYSRRLIESSKDSREVSMNGTQLVDMFLSSVSACFK